MYPAIETHTSCFSLNVSLFLHGWGGFGGERGLLIFHDELREEKSLDY